MTAEEDFTESFFFPYRCVISRAGADPGGWERTNAAGP
jgi:hypothetical protein